jgi:hypothetical protein
MAMLRKSRLKSLYELVEELFLVDLQDGRKATESGVVPFWDSYFGQIGPVSL